MVAAGTRIRQYQLLRELGRGGMGTVFLARDTLLGRRVAMKFLAVAASDVTSRFLAEARATARCSHENIVVIHEADVHEGQPYMVLEYLEGTTLSGVMDGRRVPVPQALDLIIPVVRALACAHEFGIVHRDLKPENIFVTASGAIKVLDFGIAKLFASARDDISEDGPPLDARAAQLGSVPAGTLPYMAPEQVFMDSDPRTDLWAVGVILYEMLSGHSPFGTRDPERLLDDLLDLDKPVARIGDHVAGLPDGLEEIVHRCLAKRQEARFPSARALLDELEPLAPRRYGRPLARDENPYPGLAAFVEADAERFFGRAREVAELLVRVERAPLVGVIGPSGAGKSSLVRAGVVPTLRSTADWEALSLRPGRHPIASVAALLAHLDSTLRREELAQTLRVEPGSLGTYLRDRAEARGCRILVFVDQLEELHTLGCDATERAAFLACLTALADDVASPLRLIVALRADFLDRIAEDRGFTDELARSLWFLRPPDERGLREALVGPLELAGHSFESPELVDDVLRELRGPAGALPLLSFAAVRLWDARDRRRKVVTRVAYEAMRGVSGALATHADEVIAGLPAGAQRLARALLCRLVTPEGTRDVVDLAELAGLAGQPADLQALVELLVNARLVVVQARGEREGTTVELVHESLVDGWPTLRRWLEEGKGDAAFLGELRAAARQWDSRGRQPGLLWRGEIVADARRWRARYRGAVTAREAEFLHAVFALAGRATRVRRGVIGATIAVLSGTIVAGAIALLSIRAAESRAVQEAGRARSEADRARGAELQVKRQLAVIEEEQRARLEATNRVARGEEQLRTVNAELEAALRRATGESRRAKEAAAKAQKLAQSLVRANQELERLLQVERARAEELERQRRKISKQLR